MTVKRCRDEHHNDIMSMGNSLMLYSKQGKVGGGYSNRMFECRTCNRLFPSFQALGGHRASHKKPKMMTGGHNHPLSTSSPKPKTHQCSICGLEFAIGQALGGHMRRHKTVINKKNVQPLLPLSLSLKSQSSIVKKSNSMRVLFLDLNLTPSENKFLFGKILNAPVLDCFL